LDSEYGQITSEELLEEKKDEKLFPQCPKCKKLTGGFCPEHSKIFMEEELSESD
jgi:hypothetical protein